MKYLEAMVLLALIGVMVALLVFLVQTIIDNHRNRMKGDHQ